MRPFHTLPHDGVGFVAVRKKPKHTEKARA